MIRARLTQRGFKDLDKGNLQTFSGTAYRLAEVDCLGGMRSAGPVLGHVDGRRAKSLLECISDEELAAATGEPLRVVNFELDPDSRIRRLCSDNRGALKHPPWYWQRGRTKMIWNETGSGIPKVWRGKLRT